MKKIKLLYNKILIFFTISLLISCSDLSEVNKNPNNISQTHPQSLLTQIITKTFEVEGTRPLYATRIIVQSDGESSYQYFKWGRNNFDDYNNLRQVIKMIEEAEKINNNGYIALGKFFKAYYFYNLTLKFGDIPYSEALRGETDNNYTPKYDSQKGVFIGILTELEQANELLRNYSDVPLSGDLIYNGNLDNWRRLINSFRLKVLLTLSKKEGDMDLNIRKRFEDIFTNEPIISSNEQSAELKFVNQEGSRYSEFNSSSYGSGMYMSSTFIDMLKDLKDPRLFIFADRTKKAKEDGLQEDDFDAYEGGNPIRPYNEINILATEGKVSKVNERYYKDPTTEPHNILSYSEIQFILAEATIRGWIVSDAKKFYNNAIQANFDFYQKNGKSLAPYVNSNAYKAYIKYLGVDLDNVISIEEKLQRILQQKYITSFLQGGWRIYFDHLRTGYPELIHKSEATPPTRWIYPESEYTNNRDNVSKAINTQFGEGNDNIRAMPWWLK